MEKKAAIISYLVKKLHEMYPNKQIGMTAIQKLAYLLKDNLEENFRYKLIYGPYSREVMETLNIAKRNGWLDIKRMGRKYFISVKNDAFKRYIQAKEKEEIENVVKKYGEFNTTELSIITTAFFIIDSDSLEVEDEKDKEYLVTQVGWLEPQYSEKEIEKVLSKINISVYINSKKNIQRERVRKLLENLLEEDVDAVKNPLKSRKRCAFTRFVDKKTPSGCFFLDVDYLKGYGVDKDYKKTAEWFKRSAEQGHKGAQNMLGLMYLYGRGVSKDYNEAEKWFKEAIGNGDDLAKCFLGFLYIIQGNYKQAKDLLEEGYERIKKEEGTAKAFCEKVYGILRKIYP